MATDALNELPETTSLPEPTQLKADAEAWARNATTRLGDDYAKIVRALQALDAAIDAIPPSFPAGTRLAFDQDAAPTGWTRDTAAALNDRVLRIVTGARAHGGSWTISGLTLPHTHDLASHTHTQQGNFATSLESQSFNQQATAGGTIFALTHTHTVTLSGATSGPSTNTSGAASTTAVLADGNWRPLHRDLIVAAKD